MKPTEKKFLADDREMTVDRQVEEKNMNNEEQFHEAVRDYLYERVVKKHGDFGIDVRKYIPNRVVVGVRDGKPRWSIQGFESDVVVYHKKSATPKRQMTMNNDYFSLSVDGIKEIVLMPFVAIECKLKTIDAHALAISGYNSQLLKAMFPLCKFFFCAFDARTVTKDTTARFNKDFDGIFKSWENDKKKLAELIEQHLQKVEGEFL